MFVLVDITTMPEDVQYAEELDAEGNKVILSGDGKKNIDGLNRSIHNNS